MAGAHSKFALQKTLSESFGEDVDTHFQQIIVSYLLDIKLNFSTWVELIKISLRYPMVFSDLLQMVAPSMFQVVNDLEAMMVKKLPIRRIEKFQQLALHLNLSPNQLEQKILK